MALSVQKLRWGLVAGVALLLVVLGAYAGYGRYKALKTWHKLLKQSGATITHETNGFTYSQSLKGKTVFTLHAAKAIQRSDGTWSLRDAELTLYSKTSTRADHIYGAAFEYDPQAGVAKAIGEVHMDLEAPQAFAGAVPTMKPQRIRGKEGRAPSALREADASMQTIHVRTSSLVYVRSLGVAATSEDVEFTFGDVECHAHGAEFEQGESTVHLLADVRMKGDLHGQPLNLTATKADLDRANNIASLARPVLHAGNRTLTANNAVLHLRKDGSVEEADADGNVTLLADTRTIHAANLLTLLTANSQPQTVRLTGGVTLEDISPRRPMRGAAHEVTVGFDEDGQAKIITANGNASLALSERSAKASLARSIVGDRIVMTLVQDESRKSSRLTDLRATGNAHVQGESLVPHASLNAPRKMTILSADDLHATFIAGSDGKAQVQHVVGLGHTQRQQLVPEGEQQSSTSDSLDISFLPAAKATAAKPAGELQEQLQIASATQSGHVRLHTTSPARGSRAASETTASCEHAFYEGASQQLTLTGQPQFAQNGTEVAANTLLLDQFTGNAEAHGNVVATFGDLQKKMPNITSSTVSSKRAHVQSDSAKFLHNGQFAEFFGTDAHPARLWQEASQIQAATLTLDGSARTLSARPATAAGTVSTVFANSSQSSAPKPPSRRKTPNNMRLTSSKLDYSDSTHEAVFAGSVKMEAATGIVRSQRAVVFLTAEKQSTATPSSTLAAADPLTSSIDHAVASGAVHLEEPGRNGTGEQLLYTAATDGFVLTGNPARIVDTQQGSVTGTTLLFGAADSTIIVAGTPADGKHGRVRTETDVKP